MTPDIINGVIEFVGSLLTWKSVVQVYKDRGYAGIYAPAIVFFTTWGFWNLFYYPHLGQWVSFAGGVSLNLANICWFALMLRYGKKK